MTYKNVLLNKSLLFKNLENVTIASVYVSIRKLSWAKSNSCPHRPSASWPWDSYGASIPAEILSHIIRRNLGVCHPRRGFKKSGGIPPMQGGVSTRPTYVNLQSKMPKYPNPAANPVARATPSALSFVNSVCRHYPTIPQLMMHIVSLYAATYDAYRIHYSTTYDAYGVLLCRHI